MTRGKDHDMEPEVDSLSYIDFEDDMRAFEFGSEERWMFHYDALKSVIFECTGRTDASYLAIVAAVLMQAHSLDPGPYDLDEVALWDAMARWVNAQGFDTYNSDTRFEVFPAGTKEVE